MAERFDSKDFAWVVMAINIQRKVGGNLAELLDTVAGTIREREYMRRQVSALAAEGKLSAFVLGLLPPLFFIYLLFTRYDYVSVMFSRSAGLADARRVAGDPGDRRLLDVPDRQGGGLSMTMLFIMGVLLVFTALVLVGLRDRATPRPARVWRGPSSVIEAMTTAPSELTKDLDKSFGERVLIPLQNRSPDRPPALRRRQRRADPPQARPRRQPTRVDRRPGDERQGHRGHGRLGRRGAVLVHARRHPHQDRRGGIAGITVAGFFAPTSTSTSVPTTGPPGCCASCPTPSTC